MRYQELLNRHRPEELRSRVGVFVLPNTKTLARPRQKLPASAHMLIASQGSSFINHALASSP
jgi:hypothetical protein